jgi:beta-xylosidase
MGNDDDGDGKGEPVRTFRNPNVGAAYPPVAPATTDEFRRGTKLGLQWQWQANPQDSWYSLTAKPGSLRLYVQPRPAPDNLFMTPSLLLQKWAAPAFTATTALQFDPKQVGETAGLMIFGLDYAWVGLRQGADGMKLMQRVSLAAKDGKAEQENEAVTWSGTSIYLRVTVSAGGLCRFSYSSDGERFSPIGSEFSAKPGQWVGAKVGLFAVAGANASTETKRGHADWEWFRVSGWPDRRVVVR